MISDVWERMLLPAGIYPCQWIYRGEELPGEVSLEASQAPSGRIDSLGTTATSELHAVSFPSGTTVDEMRCRLPNQHEAVLMNTRLLHVAPGRVHLWAENALVGVGLPDDLLFHSVEFQVGGLTELAGVSPIKDVCIPNTSIPGAEARATWDVDAARQSWSTEDGGELTLEFQPSSNADGYSFSIISTPVIKISETTPKQAQWWVDKYLRPLAEITALATQRKQTTSWIMLCHGEKNFPAQLFADGIAQQPYKAARPKPAELVNGTGGLIHLGPEGASLPDLLAGWHTLKSEYVTFFGYLAASPPDTMSIKSRFLALVPGLEGFHVAKYGKGRVKLAERLRKLASNDFDESLRERVQARADGTV